jgi:hypothetical protein
MLGIAPPQHFEHTISRPTQEAFNLRLPWWHVGDSYSLKSTKASYSWEHVLLVDFFRAFEGTFFLFDLNLIVQVSDN